MTRISLGWTCSSYFGWGVYCLNLALQWSKRKEIEAQSIFPVQAAQIEIDALARRSLLPFFERSGRDIPADLYIAALGNNCETSIVRAVKGPKIGAMFFEWPFSKEAIAATKEYDLIIVGSRWNEHVLRSYGVDNVCTILQGVDPSLFHPGPKRGLYPGKFLIFSGGKTEPRKGQDLVVNAFRIFAEKHPDAVLVTAWHSPRRMTQGMDLDVRKVADRVIDVGAVPNALMAPIYRECDVALFPNWAEGGTNLVAMECICLRRAHDPVSQYRAYGFDRAQRGLFAQETGAYHLLEQERDNRCRRLGRKRHRRNYRDIGARQTRSMAP